MIAHLRGTILEKHPNQVVLEASGVGYEVQIPVSTYTSLPDAGAAVSLRIYTHVREDALSLFGFATVEEKVLFQRLLSVSGVGPKLAIAILSGRRVSELIDAIRTGHAERLRMPGIGKKTAERIVLELKEKFGGFASPEPLTALKEDVISALQNLGCSRTEAEKAVAKANDGGAPPSFEPLFREALALIR